MFLKRIRVTYIAMSKEKEKANMIFTNIKRYQDSDDTVVEVMQGNETIRKVELIVGNHYIINPLNKQKKKNRGRIVIYTGSFPRWSDNECMAKVKYLDTKRPGRVDISDIDNIAH